MYTSRLLALVLALLVFATPSQAQGIGNDTPLRPVTRTYAITNARVVQAPGRVLDRATVLVRDGIIQAVGPEVRVPYDADVIDGDSLTVYAGFIDALGHAGVAEPDEDRGDIDDPGDPPRTRAGITPERDVRPHIDPSHGTVEALRNLGFTAAHTVPHGRVLPGQGTVFLLRPAQRGERDGSTLLSGPLSLYARFTPARGVYPATPMGLQAVLHDLFTEASLRRDATARYGDRPGASRPAYDPVLDALLPTLDGSRPLFFEVSNTNQAFYALRMARMMNLPLVLAGLPESTPVAARLKAQDVPILAPLALPDTVATDTTEYAVAYPSTTPGGTVFVTNRRIRGYDDVAAEAGALRGQRAAAIGRREANAATLAEATVPFAFTTLDVKPDKIRSNLRRMIAAGLSPDDALAALTTTPAAMFGLDRQLGTVEAGKLANLVITDGDYFGEDTKVRFVFVEGVRFEGDTDEAPEGADPNASETAAGTWAFSVSTPGGAQEGTFTIEGSGSDLSGTITSDDTRNLTTVTLEGNVLTFSFDQPGMGTIQVRGVIDGDTFTGTAEVGPMGSFSMTATRRPGF